MESGELKIQELQLSLCNINTISDRKALLINPSVEKCHIQLFTELNIDTIQQYNTVTACRIYDWVIIPKVQNFSQRVGIRFCKSLHKFVSIKVLNFKYLTQNRTQSDQSSVQILHVEIKCYHVTCICILVYRAPDCRAENRNMMFEYIETVYPHLAMGDINIDLNVKENVKLVQEKMSLVNIVKKPTRVSTRLINNKSVTSKKIIDHVYTRKNWASKLKYSVEKLDPKISDHCLIKISLSAKVPPVRLKIPQILDPNRRYFPRNNIDWSQFEATFNYERYREAPAELYYSELKKSMIWDCEKNDITFRKFLPAKKVFRFVMSAYCRELKKQSCFAKYILKQSRQDYDQALELYNHYSRTIHEREMFYQAQNALSILNNNELFYKFVRNTYFHQVRRESNADFKQSFAKNKNNTAKLWEIANRSKGIVSKTVEQLSDPLLHSAPMGVFFQSRSKIGLTDEDVDIDFSKLFRDHDFNEDEIISERIFQVDIEITDIDIDKCMRHKPSASPDPDSLSMSIYNQFYFNNSKYRTAIRTLFTKCINLEHRIPGLEHHTVSLYLKKPDASTQKDLRPVASFESLPKRMLRYTVQTVKKVEPRVFYKLDEYSQANAGTLSLVMTVYEDAQQVYFQQAEPTNACLGVANKKHKKGLVATSFQIYDKSNAFCTFKKDIAIGRLSLKGNTRNLLCHALVSQQTFSVRTKISESIPLEITTGSAQGLPNSAEWFSSVSKCIVPPDLSHIEPLAVVKRRSFVDDDTDLVHTPTDTHQIVLDTLDEQIQTDSLFYGLKNNADKKVVMRIGCKPPVSERILGVITNTMLNSHDEIGPTIAKLRKAVNSLRSTNCLSRHDRILTAKLLIHAQLGNLLFIVVHAAPCKKEQFRKDVVQSFRKAAFLRMSTPTVDCEGFLFGMSFTDYCNTRIVKFITTQSSRDPSFLNNITVNRSKYCQKRGCNIGILLRKYCNIRNQFDENYFKKVLCAKKKTVNFHKNKCLQFIPNFEI